MKTNHTNESKDIGLRAAGLIIRMIMKYKEQKCRVILISILVIYMNIFLPIKAKNTTDKKYYKLQNHKAHLEFIIIFKKT